MRLAVVFHLIVLSVVTKDRIVSFELKCPHSSQRRFRASGVCNGTLESSYACLFDIKKKIYIETCNQPADFVLQGEKYVISGGRLSSPCNTNRYQPFNFWSSLQTSCYYQKSLCYETGQLIFSHWSTNNDSTCRCDHTKSYAFVTKPMNPCFCVPSQEDCSCYKVQCPVLLSSDYKCKSNEAYKIDRGCETAAERTLNNSTPNEEKNNKDMKAYLIRESWPLVALVAVCLVLVLVLLVAVLAYLQWMEEYNKSVEGNLSRQDYRRFYRDIIGNWSYLINHLQPKFILKDLFNKGFITELIYEEKIKCDIDQQNIFVLLLFLQKCYLPGHVELFESLLKHQSTKLQQITVKRWPKRDEVKCREKLHLVKEIIAATNEKDFVNYCFENFLFSPADYEDVVKEGIMVESLTRLVYNSLTNGSIDCLKAFVEETLQKHKTQKLLNILEELTKNLSPAILVDFTTPPSVTTGPDATENGRWKKYRIRFSMLAIGNNDIRLMSSNRMRTCLKWFIQEVAMYPDPTTIMDSSIELVPLVAEAFCGLNKSIKTRSFMNLLEVYLCGEDIIKQMSSNMQIQVSMIVNTRIISHSEADCETLAPDYYLDNFILLKNQREFLKKEIQPQLVLDAFPTDYMHHFKSIDFTVGTRKDKAEQILDIIENNDEQTKLSDYLMEVFEKESQHIYERLKNIKDAYSKRTSSIIRNMIRTFASLANINLELEAIRAVFIKRNLFEDEILHTSDTEIRDEQAMVEMLLRIIQKGNMAIGTYIEVLYSNKYDDIIEELLSTGDKYLDCCESIESVQESNKKEIMLHANLQVSKLD